MLLSNLIEFGCKIIRNMLPNFTHRVEQVLTVVNQLRHLLPHMVLEGTDMLGHINKST